MDYPKLNLPKVDLKLKHEGETTFVFDTNRKKWLVLSPEEWVRQHFVAYLITNNFPASLISLEAGLKYNSRKKRSDILVYNNEGKPFLIVECKASTIKLNQTVLNQVGVYNKTIGATFLCATNGMKTICWTFNQALNKFEFLDSIPAFNYDKNH